MSREHRNLVNTLACCLAAEHGTVELGDLLKQKGILTEDDQLFDAAGFLDMHRRDVRIILAALRAMGKLK